jgi:hypothetical protein
MAWGSPLMQKEAMMISAMAKHGKPEEPKDSPAYMFKLIGSIGLILLGGLFAGEQKGRWRAACGQQFTLYLVVCS